MVGRKPAAVGAGFTAGASDSGNVSSNSMPSPKELGTVSLDIATAQSVFARQSRGMVTTGESRTPPPLEGDGSLRLRPVHALVLRCRCGRHAEARQATTLRSCQPIERGAHRGEDLGGHVIAQAVTHNIALSTTADGVCVTQDAQMLTCRGPAALDDSSDIASRKLRGLQRANDLEACRVAQTHQYTLGSARRSRFQHARLRARYGAVVTYASGLHAFACRRVRLDVLSRPRGSNPEPVVYKTTALPLS